MSYSRFPIFEQRTSGTGPGHLNPREERAARNAFGHFCVMPWHLRAIDNAPHQLNAIGLLAPLSP